MPTLISKAPAATGLLIGLATIGCSTAMAITGHISGPDALVGILTVAGVTGGIAGAHIGGAIANGAGPPVDAPAASAAPATTQVKPVA